MNALTIPSQMLVIGYGNILRGDDGVGYQVAAAVAAWQIPQVRSLAVHQLLPELAATIAAVDTVVFVDAAVTHDATASDITVEPLVAGGDATFRTHIITPQLLLSLAQRLYGATPDAYLLTIPAIAFALGTDLSAIALTGKNLALEYLHSMFHRVE
jgi:hydrogenase maturation protease